MSFRKIATKLFHRLQKLKDGEIPPMTELQRQHVSNLKVFPSRKDMLGQFEKGGVVGELGVADGDFSQVILDVIKPDKLHLVDAWEDSDYSSGYKKVTERFKDTNISIHRGYSTEMLEQFEDGYFDWIYIDTDHSYKTTLRELDLGSKKIKTDGIIAGHDYTVRSRTYGNRYGVVEAVHEFCTINNWEIICLSLECNGHYSYALRKI